MDTKTVLEIIKMLDSQIKVITENYKDVESDPDQNIPMDPSFFLNIGKEMALTSLRDDLLQSFIVAQLYAAELNAAENNAGE